MNGLIKASFIALLLVTTNIWAVEVPGFETLLSTPQKPATEAFQLAITAGSAPTSNDEKDLFKIVSFEVQGRFPTNIIENMDITASIGYTDWNIDTISWSRGFGQLVSVGGSVRDVPVSLGLLYGLELFKGTVVSFESGFSYHFLDSQIDVDVSSPYFDESIPLKVDDVVTYSLGANVERRLSRDVWLLVGGGYRWALNPENVKVSGMSIPQDNDLEGPYLKAGLIFGIK